MSVPVGACAQCRCPIEQGDLRCAMCGLATPATVSHAERVEVRVLRCESCGAAVRYDVQAQAPRCAFCTAVMHLEGVEDPMEQTEWFISFTVQPEAAREALRAWKSGLGFFRPSDLLTRSTVEKLDSIYWVGWVFGARALVSFTADSNAGAGRSDWAPHAGQCHMGFDKVLVSASRGLTDAEAGALTPSYDLERRAPHPIGPPETVLEQFDVQRSSARERLVDVAEGLALARVTTGEVPGSRFRNVKVAALIEGLASERCAFPAYVLAYRYRDKLYRAVVSGQDARCVIGTAPYSRLRIGLVVLSVAAVVAGALGLLL